MALLAPTVAVTPLPLAPVTAVMAMTGARLLRFPLLRLAEFLSLDDVFIQQRNADGGMTQRGRGRNHGSGVIRRSFAENASDDFLRHEIERKTFLRFLSHLFRLQKFGRAPSVEHFPNLIPESLPTMDDRRPGIRLERRGDRRIQSGKETRHDEVDRRSRPECDKTDLTLHNVFNFVAVSVDGEII